MLKWLLFPRRIVGGRMIRRRGFKPVARRVATIGFLAEHGWPWPIVKALARRRQDLYVNLEQDVEEEGVGQDRRLRQEKRRRIQRLAHPGAVPVAGRERVIIMRA